MATRKKKVARKSTKAKRPSPKKAAKKVTKKKTGRKTRASVVRPPQ
jgi:hypothetical protein